MATSRGSAPQIQPIFRSLRPPMSRKPIDVLKHGLAKLSQKIKARKDDLSARLSQNEIISSADEQWLDNEGNTIDEQRILDVLESASDYERGVGQLDDAGKAIVEKLREWAGDLPAKIPGKKRKRMDFISTSKSLSINFLLSCRLGEREIKKKH